MHRRTTEVLIVGAGPAGLAAGLTLAGYGVDVLLVERRSSTSPLPRATAVSTRTMELIRSWGLEQEVRAHEVDVDFTAWGAASLSAAGGAMYRLGFPTRREAAALSPTAPAVVAQDRLEPVLLRQLRTFDNVHVRFDSEFVAVQQDGSGAIVTLRDRSSGAESVVHCRFVIGADGAHSAVRQAVGIGMAGPDDLHQVLTALFAAPLWPLIGDRRHGIYFIESDNTPGVVLVPSGGDRWLYGRFLAPWEKPADYPPDRVLDLIRAAIGTRDVTPRISRIGSFSFAAQVAQRYRDGSVFLAGDAVHRITPRGGTGMNTAIHDAYDLGWKLGWVLRGWGDEAGLLDSYEAERRPIGIRNTLRSAQPDDGAADVEARLADDLGGRVRHVWVRPGVSTLDLLGPGLTLVTGPEGGRRHSVAEQTSVRVPLEMHALPGPAATALGIGPGEALLLRPDGRLAEQWTEATLAA
jgi:putative polyketide hydroxylase